MKTNIELKKISIINFFLENDFEIPDYQRPYSWNIEKVSELRDFVLEETDISFLGNIVVLDESNEKTKIIDGQQRILTLLVLLCVIYKKIPSKLDKGSELMNISTEIKKIINKINLNFVFSNEEESLIKIKDFTLDVEKNDFPKKTYLEKSFAFFYKIVCSYDSVELQKMYKRLKELFFSKIIVYNENEAIKIFINLNSKGTPLRKSDIIKSKLFSKAKDDKYENELSHFWKEIVRKIKYEKLDNFFNFYLNSTSSSYISNAEVLTKMEERIKTTASISSLILEIEKYSDIYFNLLNPIKEYWNIFFKSVYFIKFFGFKQIYPIISIMKNEKNNQNKNKFFSILQNLLIYMIRNSTINGIYGTEIKTLLNKIKRDLFLKKYEENYKNEIEIQEASDNSVYGAFESLQKEDFKEKLIKYVLINYYENLKKSNIIEIDLIDGEINYDNVSLEHIVDKKIGNVNKYFASNTMPKEDVEIMEYFWSDEKNDKYKFMFGNLTLMSKEKNSNLGKKRNKTWKNKIQSLNSNSFLSLENDKYKPTGIFTDRIIEMRTKYLIEEIKNLLVLNYSDDW